MAGGNGGGNGGGEKTQYQLDVEAGYKVYKVGADIDGSKLGTNKGEDRNRKKSVGGYQWFYSDDTSLANFRIVALNEYDGYNLKLADQSDGEKTYKQTATLYFTKEGTAKFRAYWPDGSYYNYSVTVSGDGGSTNLKTKLGTYYTIKGVTITHLNGWKSNNTNIIKNTGEPVNYGKTEMYNGKGEYYDVVVFTPMELARKYGFSNQSGSVFYWGGVRDWQDGGHYINITGSYKFICATPSNGKVHVGFAEDYAKTMFNKWKANSSRLPFDFELKWLYENSASYSVFKNTYTSKGRHWEWCYRAEDSGVTLMDIQGAEITKFSTWYDYKNGKAYQWNLADEHFRTVIDLSKDFTFYVEKLN